MDWDVKDCKLMADDGSGWQEAGNHLAVAVVMDAIRDERAACASLRSERDKLLENAHRICGGGCTKHGNSLTFSEFEGAGGLECPICLKAERDKLREALKDLVNATDHEDGVGIMLSVDRARAALGET